jgi:hypothetical protein
MIFFETNCKAPLFIYSGAKSTGIKKKQLLYTSKHSKGGSKVLQTISLCKLVSKNSFKTLLNMILRITFIEK